MLRLGLGIAGAGRLTREGAEVTDPDWRGLFARLLAAVRIRKAVRLKSHEAIEIPLTWGWLKPVVLIPARYREWSEDQRSPALLHELCHIKRGDLFIMFLVRFSLAVYWFNPLCWVVFRRLQQEQERSGRSFTTIMGSDGTDISILFHLDPGENSGALYERITARVKQAMPGNITLEPKFDAKAGAVTLKLSGSGTKGATTEFIGKLIDAIKSELNAGKDRKAGEAHRVRSSKVARQDESASGLLCLPWCNPDSRCGGYTTFTPSPYAASAASLVRSTSGSQRLCATSMRSKGSL